MVVLVNPGKRFSCLSNWMFLRLLSSIRSRFFHRVSRAQLARGDWTPGPAGRFTFFNHLDNRSMRAANFSKREEETVEIGSKFRQLVAGARWTGCEGCRWWPGAIWWGRQKEPLATMLALSSCEWWSWTQIAPVNCRWVAVCVLAFVSRKIGLELNLSSLSSDEQKKKSIHWSRVILVIWEWLWLLLNGRKDAVTAKSTFSRTFITWTSIASPFLPWSSWPVNVTCHKGGMKTVKLAQNK